MTKVIGHDETEGQEPSRQGIGGTMPQRQSERSGWQHPKADATENSKAL